MSLLDSVPCVTFFMGANFALVTIVNVQAANARIAIPHFARAAMGIKKCHGCQDHHCHDCSGNLILCHGHDHRICRDCIALSSICGQCHGCNRCSDGSDVCECMNCDACFCKKCKKHKICWLCQVKHACKTCVDDDDVFHQNDLICWMRRAVENNDENEAKQRC